MRELEIEEVKKLQLAILSEVSKFCEEHSITYFLCAGTLLGAIRHQGYIPWDDDIDIMMPRPDYERFVEKYHSEKFELLDSRIVKGYYYPFIKVADKNTLLIENDLSTIKYGINIDVFPLDGMPKDKSEIKTQIDRISLKKAFLAIKKGGKANKQWSWYKKIMFPFLKFVTILTSTVYIINKIIEIAKRYKFEESENAGIVVWGYGIREICPKYVFTGSINVTFEGQTFKAPKNFDIYLSIVYGDYMKLPPIEQQIRKHSFKAYVKS